ncbi:hypothetical protein SCNRRL3882_1642 [Streptomyces chartreusis NRRL 3882]|uniref:Uncharacterized protein n=2 Tax=Streptomyces TaxID=1883 RepID=A0A2N9B4E5_STRCX|nr:hypothetical protein SCNRRL3882_1642 [Streptomyces chartreusis NRRL 3882]
MGDGGRLRALRVALRMVIMIEVLLCLVWLVRAGCLTGQRPNDGDIARWVRAERRWKGTSRAAWWASGAWLNC